MANSIRRPFSIRIFLPDGDSEGLRIIEKSNWTGVGVVFNRSSYAESAKRDEFRRTGVYILVGASEESNLPTVYVGEGDPVKPRLDDHYANKDFWTWGAFFVSKDAGLNKAHVKHLESRLIEMARVAKQCRLDNTVQPARPNLSEADMADVESYLEDLLSIVPLLGLSAFERPLAMLQEKRNILRLAAKGVTAEGYEDAKGFVVRQGARVVKGEVPSIHEYLVTMRRDLREQGVLAENGDFFVFTQDYSFNSPSTAAGVVLGRSANGRREWKDERGRELKQIQAEAAKQNMESE